MNLTSFCFAQTHWPYWVSCPWVLPMFCMWLQSPDCMVLCREGTKPHCCGHNDNNVANGVERLTDCMAWCGGNKTVTRLWGVLTDWPCWVSCPWVRPALPAWRVLRASPSQPAGPAGSTRTHIWAIIRGSMQKCYWKGPLTPSVLRVSGELFSCSSLPVN